MSGHVAEGRRCRDFGRERILRNAPLRGGAVPFVRLPHEGPQVGRGLRHDLRVEVRDERDGNLRAVLEADAPRRDHVRAAEAAPDADVREVGGEEEVADALLLVEGDDPGNDREGRVVHHDVGRGVGLGRVVAPRPEGAHERAGIDAVALLDPPRHGLPDAGRRDAVVRRVLRLELAEPRVVVLPDGGGSHFGVDFEMGLWLTQSRWRSPRLRPVAFIRRPAAVGGRFTRKCLSFTGGLLRFSCRPAKRR